MPLREYLCISNDGNVFLFGYSTYYHQDNKGGVLYPKMIPLLKNIKSLSTNEEHTACIDNDGNVFTFGSNIYGKLGIGIDGDTLKFTHIPQKLKLPPCKQVCCGNSFTICLTESGEVYSFGYNERGQLGFGNN